MHLELAGIHPFSQAPFPLGRQFRQALQRAVRAIPARLVMKCIPMHFSASQWISMDLMASQCISMYFNAFQYIPMQNAFKLESHFSKSACFCVLTKFVFQFPVSGESQVSLTLRRCSSRIRRFQIETFQRLFEMASRWLPDDRPWLCG